MTLTDTHCHLDFHKFDADRGEVLERAVAAGLNRILIPGVTAGSSRGVVELAASHPMLYAGVGVHPTEANTWTRNTASELRSLLRPSETSSPAGPSKVVAIGEIGLDYYWEAAPHDVQQSVLKAQLELAAELNLPVVIHFREKGDAADGPCASDLMKILEDWRAGLGRGKSPLVNRPGVLHSFSGSRQTAERAIGLGFYIGVTGPITYKSAEAKRACIAGLPLETLLIETDAPFLAPVPQRGRRNEPAFVRYIADKIAEIHNRTAEEVAACTTANAGRLFCWEESA